MPRIVLKPNSAEYADRQQNKAPEVNSCDMPGCRGEGAHKAPKHRGLNEYYRFCLQHVQEYNRAWDYFSGMSEGEIQDHIFKSYYGDRPTWRYGVEGSAEDALREKIRQAYSSDHRNRTRKDGRNRWTEDQQASPEIEALAVMGLEPPLTLRDIKTRYKELAKKYHPDLNRGCPESEELLKRVNMSYTILKVAYEQFEKLPEKA